MLHSIAVRARGRYIIVILSEAIILARRRGYPSRSDISARYYLARDKSLNSSPSLAILPSLPLITANDVTAGLWLIKITARAATTTMQQCCICNIKKRIIAIVVCLGGEKLSSSCAVEYTFQSNRVFIYFIFLLMNGICVYIPLKPLSKTIGFVARVPSGWRQMMLSQFVELRTTELIDIKRWYRETRTRFRIE